MLLDNKDYLYSYIKLLQLNYNTAEKLALLHPIDHALAIALPSIGIQWFTILKFLNITYDTPCIFFNSNRDKLLYEKDYCILTVSNNAFNISSGNKIFDKVGKVEVSKVIYKDKDRLKNCVICFKKSINQKSYIQSIL